MSKRKNKQKLMKRIREELNLASHGYQDLYPSDEDKGKGAWIWGSLTGVQVGSTYSIEVLLNAPAIHAVAHEVENGHPLHEIRPGKGEG